MDGEKNSPDGEQPPKQQAISPPEPIQTNPPEPKVVNITAQIINIEAKETTIHAKQPEGGEQTADAALKDRIKKSDRLMIGLTAVIAITGILGWVELHNAGIVTTAQADRIVAADERFADAMEAANTLNGAAAKASREQSKTVLDQTIEQARLDQRAWIGVKGMDMVTLELGKPIVVTVVLNNTGKTPARNAKFTVNAVIAGAMVDIDKYALSKERPLPKTRPPSVLFPNGEYTFPITIERSTDDVGPVTDGKIFVYFFGEVTYEDIFKRTHGTEFCGVYGSTVKRFQTCEQHNRAN